uniref:Carboxylic ester hydrolase n=1 Tax=Timema shepardi TaxID=629360 RepID=A0A7R9AYF2_TIMSH|nr:unnamed protein product [Timema shepardi]
MAVKYEDTPSMCSEPYENLAMTNENDITEPWLAPTGTLLTKEAGPLLHDMVPGIPALYNHTLDTMLEMRFNMSFSQHLLLLMCSAANLGLGSAQNVNDTLVIRTEEGSVRGRTQTSVWGDTYYSFQGIPYAEPPVGNLRFKAPRPVIPWEGVRDALSEGNSCHQSYIEWGKANMSEDCLYLNVYVPQLPSNASESSNLSVLFWIHGGGFSMGSGDAAMWGPDYFVDKNIVVVTINYRLGALGFLALEHQDVSVNAGMKDQVAALRWVQKNIAHFGGDPGKVTVAGESAGSASVELLLLSNITDGNSEQLYFDRDSSPCPLTLDVILQNLEIAVQNSASFLGEYIGLFHRAISQSGSAFILISSNGNSTAYKLAEILGATDLVNNDQVLEFLRSKSASDIIAAQAHTGGEFTPEVEPKVQDGNEVFLSDDPLTLLQEGRIRNVPYIAGFNSEEDKYIEQTLDADPSLWDTYSDLEQFIPSNLNLEKGSPESLELAAQIKEVYFGNQSVGPDTLQELVNILSDNFMATSSIRSIKLHLARSPAPLFVYLFTYDGMLTVSNYRATYNYTIKGPAHADDLAYLFSFHAAEDLFQPDEAAWNIVRRFTSLWANFIKTGDPTYNEDINWTPATLTNKTYLQIDEELSLHQDLLGNRMALWDSIYQDLQ